MATKEEILDAIANMTVLELSASCSKDFEEQFGVTAAAPVGRGRRRRRPVAAAPPRPRRSRTSSTSSSPPPATRRSSVIKEVRSLTNLGLKEAKDLVDSAPKPVLEKVVQGRRREGQGGQLEAAGASVELK